MVNLHLSGRAAHHLRATAAATGNPSSQKLTDNLNQAFSTFLQQNGIDASGFKLTIQPDSGTAAGPSAGPSSGQSNVPGQNSGAAAVASKLGFNALIPPDTLVQQPAPAPPVQHWYAADATDDAYWSKQPAPVQQLREIQDQGQREAVATQLAGAGYRIDVPIMVWGWDAGKTNALRASAGYSWVPSALQSPVSAAPGITGPGITPYDPKHPPPGSIQVS